ncbi:MAG: hypothetical protein ACM3OC_00935 [Deltaproteobacteria bacterium]
MHRLSVVFILLFFPTVVLAEENITITTYYPSPNGIYRSLTLYPGNQPAAASNGMMYFDQGDRTVKYYNSTDWLTIGSLSSASVIHVGGRNSGAGATLTVNCPAGKKFVSAYGAANQTTPFLDPASQETLVPGGGFYVKGDCVGKSSCSFNPAGAANKALWGECQ